MPVIGRYILAILAGLLLGGLVNSGLLMIGPELLPVPRGVDVSDIDSVSEHMHRYKPKHFLLPFLAHALGSFSGALIAALLAPAHRRLIAMVIGCCFLAGGIAAAVLLPAPLWFIAVDLLLAYLPMAWLGGRLARRLKP